MKHTFSRGTLLLSGALIFTLPGCKLMDWFKGKSESIKPVTQQQTAVTETQTFGIEFPTDGSRAIVTMDGKPVVTEKSLQKEKTELIEANPQLKQMIAFMDEKQIGRNLTEGLAHRVTINRFIAENNIAESKEYKDELDRIVKSVKDALNQKYMLQKFPVTVAEADIRAFYDKNKDIMPNLMISRGGVKTQGISFSTEAQAKEFLTKLKEARGNIEKAAKDAGLSDKVKDFNLVNDQSVGIDAQLRDKIIALKTLPANELVKVNDKTFWVIHAASREAATYQPYEQIKAELKQYIEREKMGERFEKELKGLRDQYKITIDESYFGAGEAQDEMQAPTEEPMPKAPKATSKMKPMASKAV